MIQRACYQKASGNLFLIANYPVPTPPASGMYIQKKKKRLLNWRKPAAQADGARPFNLILLNEGRQSNAQRMEIKASQAL